MRALPPPERGVDHEDMRIELSGPAVVDLVRGTVSWQASSGCCDLCREERDLFRLLDSPDALCRSCFAMWHG